jgi:hypothetical protein
VLFVFVLGAIAGIAYYIAYHEYQELSVVKYSVVRESISGMSSEAYASENIHLNNIDNGAVDTVDEGDEKQDLGHSSPDSSVERTIAEYFPENPKLAIAIAKAESGLNPKATNHNRNNSDDYGVFQINSIHNPTYEEKTQPEANIRLARRIYERDGWGAWSAYLNKSYLKFL